MYKLDSLNNEKGFRHIKDFNFDEICTFENKSNLDFIYIIDLLELRETNFQCLIPMDYLRKVNSCVYKILGVHGNSNGTYFTMQCDETNVHIEFGHAYKTGTESVYRLNGRVFGYFK